MFDLLDRYTKCPFNATCNNLIPKVIVCAGRAIPKHRGLLFRNCRHCNGFEWVSPAEHVAAASLQPPKSFSESKSHRVHTHVGTSDHPNEHDFDPDDRISSESELDIETRALLYLLCPDDFPASYEPILDDSQLAQLIHQMPENNESFLDLLRAAGPSPVKSVTSSI
jgi:hypothetical protein